MAHPLDNVVWHALTGPRQALGEVRGLAGRFHPEVSPFGAIADRTDAAWSDLAGLVGAGHVTCLFGSGVALPDGWEELMRVPCGQLVAEDVTTDGESEGLVPLGPDDVPEMLELVAATKPGPFSVRTVEFGGYVGLRDDAGTLIAMAGERLRCDGYTEISAVCTAADQQGKGLGTRMVRALVESIHDRGEQAFLHVADTNENAYRLYLALGFRERSKPSAVVVRVPS
ncbi:MAG TPA: GNAT family N-acetyltransferase [Acidimicrobiales bacterium]|nr:GNAT family N-acetyltransferase [Acidimicrobiales bacterium]